MNKSNTNLGEGSIGKLMFRLALPAVVSQVVNMLYNIVDRIYIGHIPNDGVMALTGLGLCFPIIMFVTAFSSMFGMGGAPQAAIKMGQGDNNGAEKILGNSTSALAIVSVILTITFLFFGRDLLFLFGASENTITFAWQYMRIYVCGTIFVQMALGLNMFITTQGFATYSMATVLIGAILNIILDPIFIFVLGMGVRGAATATIVSQAVSAAWVLKFLSGKKTRLKIKKENLRIERKVIVPIIVLGLSPFVMQSTESILNIAFNSSLQRYGGDFAVGSMTILASVIQICLMPMQGLTQGGQPIISYNYGAGKIDRVKKTIRLQIITCVSFGILMWILIEGFPLMFIKIFNDKEELLDIATWSLRVYIAGVFMLGLQYACQQAFVALGQAKVSLFIACLRKLILLIPLIYILPRFFDNKVFAVFLAEPISDIISAIVTVIIFRYRIPKVLKAKDEGMLGTA